MNKAECSKCRELKPVWNDNGFTFNDDGSFTHNDPVCKECSEKQPKMQEPRGDF